MATAPGITVGIEGLQYTCKPGVERPVVEYLANGDGDGGSAVWAVA